MFYAVPPKSSDAHKKRIRDRFDKALKRYIDLHQQKDGKEYKTLFYCIQSPGSIEVKGNTTYVHHGEVEKWVNHEEYIANPEYREKWCHCGWISQLQAAWFILKGWARKAGIEEESFFKRAFHPW